MKGTVGTMKLSSQNESYPMFSLVFSAIPGYLLVIVQVDDLIPEAVGDTWCFRNDAKTGPNPMVLICVDHDLSLGPLGG